MKFKIKTLILAVFIPLLLNACASNRGVISLNIPAPQSEAKYNNETIFIKSVTDNRIFEEKPTSPNIPSLGFGGAEKASVTLKKRAVARKRNAYGKALGDIILQEGETVESIIKGSLARSFTELGYKVINEKSQITKDTIIIEASINKFWSWMNIGFWTLGLTSEIDVKIMLEKHNEVRKISAVYEERFMTARGSNWIKIMNKNLDNFNDEVKKSIKSKEFSKE